MTHALISNHKLQSAENKLNLIIDGPGDARANMDKDAYLFHQGEPVMRFYSWKEKSYSIGYFQSIDEVRKILPVEDNHCPIVRRITGGGVVEHGDDLTFSIVLAKKEMPVFGNTQSSYQLINNIIISVITGVSQDKKIKLYPTNSIPHAHERKSYFCFQKPTKYDLMLNGIKIGGNAQRRSGGKLLHQGSVRIIMDDFKRQQFMNGFYDQLHLLFGKKGDN